MGLGCARLIRFRVASLSRNCSSPGRGAGTAGLRPALHRASWNSTAMKSTCLHPLPAGCERSVCVTVSHGRPAPVTSCSETFWEILLQRLLKSLCKSEQYIGGFILRARVVNGEWWMVDGGPSTDPRACAGPHSAWVSARSTARDLDPPYVCFGLEEARFISNERREGRVRSAVRPGNGPMALRTKSGRAPLPQSAGRCESRTEFATDSQRIRNRFATTRNEFATNSRPIRNDS